MAFTYDVSTDRGLVRLLIRDTNTADATAQVFTDAEIDAFLTLEGQNLRRAAAMALEVMASNEAYVQKVMRLLDVTTNGAATAAALMARASALRDQADRAEATEDGGAFDWAEQVATDAAARDRVWNEALRAGA